MFLLSQIFSQNYILTEQQKIIPLKSPSADQSRHGGAHGDAAGLAQLPHGGNTNDLRAPFGAQGLDGSGHARVGVLGQIDPKGLPILAHPTLYHMGKDALQTLVSLLKEAGLAGIEAVYSTYSAGEEREMRQLAARNGLLISGGSDFHGSNKPGLELATGYHGKLVIPFDIWERLREKGRALYEEA